MKKQNSAAKSNYQNIRKKIWLAIKRAHQDKKIGSLNTVSTYTSSIAMFANYLMDNAFLIGGGDDTRASFSTLLKFADRDIVTDYLKKKIENKCSIKGLELDVQALNFWFNDLKCYKFIQNQDKKNRTDNNLGENLRLSEILTRMKELDNDSLIQFLAHNKPSHLSKNYSKEQIEIIMNHVSPKNAFAIKLCWLTGIRVHELLTIRRLNECAPSFRKLSGIKKMAEQFKFLGLNGKLYVVKGKGGLIRVVNIPSDIAEELETLRLQSKYIIKDRHINYPSLYNIGGGNALSKSFARASKCWLGWSKGIHSLRHDYAKKRLKRVFNLTGNYNLARAVVSQELGHFRLAITDVYLY